MASRLTGADAARLCGVKTSTIRKWKERGLIKPVGLNHRGWPVYDQLDIARTERRLAKRAGRL